MEDKQIVALSDFEHVLIRPTMYVGPIQPSEEKIFLVQENQILQKTKTLSVGQYKLFNEILDNAIDEAKRCKGKMELIRVSVDGNRVTIEDTGGGFLNPNEINPKTKLSNVATAFSSLRAGSNFYNESKEETLIGTNGVGSSLVNMLSDFFQVETSTKDITYSITWNKFEIVHEGTVKNKTKKTGTRVSFVLRSDIFPDYTWDYEYIYSQLVFRNFILSKNEMLKNLRLEFWYDNKKQNLGIDFFPKETFFVDSKIGLLGIFPDSGTISFVNGTQCTGTHLKGITDYLNETIFKADSAFYFYDVFLFLELKPSLVKFSDQNKTKFITLSKEIVPVLEKNFFGKLKKEFKESDLYKSILQKIAEKNSEKDLSALKSKKNKASKKISDKYFPPSKEKDTLFIVEGGSALGSILQRRNSKTDGVYALRGKIKNPNKISELGNNTEILDLMNILNLEPLKETQCSYKKIIFACDRDPDGLGHITTLLLNLFYRWFKHVIRDSRLYILEIPLMSIEKNKEIIYIYNLNDLSKYSGYTNLRYLKGLGALNIKDWEKIMAERNVYQLTEDDTYKDLLEIIFGNSSTERKLWINSFKNI